MAQMTKALPGMIAEANQQSQTVARIRPYGLGISWRLSTRIK